MRLLNSSTRQIEEFMASRIPDYAILSHTWGDDEVFFADIRTDRAKQKAGYRKMDVLKLLWTASNTFGSTPAA